MNAPPSRQRGFSMVEMVVVMAMLAILLALVTPNFLGFLDRGKRNAYEADQLVLQTAVESWRTDVVLQPTRPWPILQGGTSCLGKVNPTDGSLTQEGCNPYLDIAALAQEDFFTKADAIRSANHQFNATATNPRSGTYAWYLDGDGNVASFPSFIDGVYP